MPYRQLIVTLSECAERIRGASDNQDRLREIGNALLAVIEFIQHDPQVVEADADSPLTMLLAALNDVSAGARPALFSEPPPRDSDKPTDLGRDHAHALLAAAAEHLMRGGRSRKEAGRWIEHRLRKFGVANIGATQILNWRARASDGKGPKALRIVWEKALAAPPQADAEQLAEALIAVAEPILRS